MLPNKTFLHIILLVSAIILVLWLFSNIVGYVLISLVISTVLRPVTDYIDNIEIFRVKVPRILAVFISFVILASIPLLFILLFVPLIFEQVTVLQSLNYAGIIDKIKEPIDVIDHFVVHNFQTDKESGFLMKELTENSILFVESIKIGSLLNYLLGFAGTIFIYLLAVSFITFFLLYEKGLIKRSLLAVIPNQYFEVVITAIYKIEKLLSNYLIGLLLQIMIMFSIISFGLTIVGVKYALTIAIFAAIINLIPYLGPVLGYIFAIIVVFSTKNLDTTWSYYTFLTVKTIPVFVIAQLADNLLLQPIIFSKSVKAHPLEIFIAIFAGAALASGVGMIAAIPVYTVIRVSYIELSAGYRQYRVFKTNNRTNKIEIKRNY